MKKTVWSVFGVLSLCAASTAWAAGVAGTIAARGRGFDEVPALSTPGVSHLNATVDEDGTEIDYQFDYTNVRGHITQAHIHFGQKGVNGGITIFLCSNLGNGPAGTQACPDSPGEISGTLHSSDVLGVTSQGITAGNLGSVLRAIRAGIAYVNLHTDLFPGGEVRGQLIFTAAP